MNKLQSFLTNNCEVVQAVELGDQAKIDGGVAPTWGPNGTLEGCIPHGPILKTEPTVVKAPGGLAPSPVPG